MERQYSFLYDKKVEASPHRISKSFRINYELKIVFGLIENVISVDDCKQSGELCYVRANLE
jgi:hypothetical protein